MFKRYLCMTLFSGDKGEPGVDCDVIEINEMLDRENKILSQKVFTLAQTVDDIVAKLNEIR